MTVERREFLAMREHYGWQAQFTSADLPKERWRVVDRDGVEIARGRTPAAAFKKAWVAAYASIVRSWKGVLDENGRELPCTRENVIKVLTEFPEILRAIQ
jgi:hypothetical protein